MRLDEIELTIFDLDGTLVPFDSDRLYTDAEEWISTHDWLTWCIATNQGGIGLRYWLEKDGFGDPDKYPTLEEFKDRIAKLFPWLTPNSRTTQVLLCTAYQSKKSGQWGPVPEDEKDLPMWRQDWRKPAPGMLLYTMEVNNTTPETTLMVGDSEEDRLAAEAAGCHFQWAWEFFGRKEPIYER